MSPVSSYTKQVVSPVTSLLGLTQSPCRIFSQGRNTGTASQPGVAALPLQGLRRLSHIQGFWGPLSPCLPQEFHNCPILLPHLELCCL